MHNYSPALLLVFLLTTPGLSVAASPELSVDGSVSTAGYYQLSWTSDQEEAHYELQEINDKGQPRRLYSGSDTAYLISGKPDGHYVYQIRHQGKDSWSEKISVEVKHHSLARAFTFFAIGATVFIATLFLVIRGTHSD